MKGVRFYEEFTAKRRGISAGQAVAVLVANGFNVTRIGDHFDRMYDAIVAPYDGHNVSPCGGQVSSSWLSAKCKRITEARAREIHPALFRMLDS